MIRQCGEDLKNNEQIWGDKIGKNQNYQMNRRNKSQMTNSSRLSQSSVNTKLRTIMKNRNGHLNECESSLDSSSKLDKYMRRLPTLPALSNPQYQTISNDSDLIRRKQAAKRSQTANCEEDLIINKDWKCDDIRQKIRSLGIRAEELIHKKLLKISKKQHSISLRNKGKDQLSEQLEELIKQIKKIKIEALEQRNIDRQEVKELMDSKINLLEKLLAEQTTQAAILKKYFFAVSTINQKKKYQLGNSRIKTVNPSRLQLDPFTPKKQVCRDTINRLSYKAPKTNEYETYRHKEKLYTLNVQPIPRSSYNREFLNCGSQPRSLACKNIDSEPFFGMQCKQKKSNYAKDYTILQADRINYKELDSYRNKIKDIQLFYAYNKNQMSPQELKLNKEYVRDQMKNTNNAMPTTTSKHSNKILIPQPVKNPIINTQSRSAYAGVRGKSSTIKHKGLDKLKYAYKSLVYC